MSRGYRNLNRHLKQEIAEVKGIVDAGVVNDDGRLKANDGE